MLGTGDRIGDWIVEGHVGSGGMGSVFRCRNVLAERILAAVKVIHPDPSEDFRERFVREVEALESLEHPAIVRVKGWGEDTERGLLWLAMDLVQGHDLAEVLQSGALSEERVRAIFAPLARGLHHAHSQGVFHRDIKPANVLLGDDGAARVVDFGIAMHDGRTRMSAAGVVPGTPAYLAPEVFGGHPIPRGLDVYAFGQMLHEALTGAPAFPEPDGMTSTARIAHVAGQKLRGEALDPGEGISASLRELVRQTTEPDPYRRLVDLQRAAAVLEGEPLSANRAGGTLFLDEMPALPDLTQEPPLLATRGVPNLPSFDSLGEPTERPPPPVPAPVAVPRLRPPAAWLPWVLVAVLSGVLCGVGVWLVIGDTVDEEAVVVSQPLAGKFVKVFYMRGEFEPAERAAVGWRALGARVELEANSSSPRTDFGRVVPTPDVKAAALVHGSLPESQLKPPATDSDVEWDVTVWFKERR